MGASDGCAPGSDGNNRTSSAGSMRRIPTGPANGSRPEFIARRTVQAASPRRFAQPDFPAISRRRRLRHHEPQFRARRLGRGFGFGRGRLLAEQAEILRRLVGLVHVPSDAPAPTPPGDSGKFPPDPSAPPSSPFGIGDFDLKSRVFGDCLAWLAHASSRKPENLRSLLGRWCRDFGIGFVLEAICAAQPEKPVDPIGWIEQRLKTEPRRKRTSEITPMHPGAAG
jgi:hypothetical protein